MGDVRLAVVVPYRDRADHLKVFLPHLGRYFTRDKADSALQVRVLVVEQAGDAPFNKGALCNAGFLMARDDADFVCFHDVDYLPIWADYSPVDRPARLVWYGAERRPVRPGSRIMMEHGHDWFFGAAVLFSVAHMEHVNGFSNGFWGWGYQDMDLRARALASGLGVTLRDGTFHPLPHPHHGANPDGTFTARSLANRARYEALAARYAEGPAWQEDGLSTLQWSLARRGRIVMGGTAADHAVVALPEPAPATVATKGAPAL